MAPLYRRAREIDCRHTRRTLMALLSLSYDRRVCVLVRRRAHVVVTAQNLVLDVINQRCYVDYRFILLPLLPTVPSCAGSTTSYRRPMQHGHVQQVVRALSSSATSLFVGDVLPNDQDESFASEATAIGACCCLARSSRAASARLALPDFLGESAVKTAQCPKSAACTCTPSASAQNYTPYPHDDSTARTFELLLQLIPQFPRPRQLRLSHRWLQHEPGRLTVPRLLARSSACFLIQLRAQVPARARHRPSG